MSVLKIVDDLPALLTVPKFKNDYDSFVWIMGRNKAIKELETFVRKSSHKPLPYLTIAPNGVRKSLTLQFASIWLDGYNATVHKLEEEVMKL